MRKCERKRIKRIKALQKISKAKRHVAALLSGLPNSNESLAEVTSKLSSGDLKIIVANPERFPGANELSNAAKDVLVERAFKLSQ